MTNKHLAIALFALCSCRAENLDPLADYFISQSNGSPSMSGVYHQGHGEHHLTNWLSVTSSSAPRVITTILKAPRTSIAAKGQIWVSDTSCYINLPEVTVWPGATNDLGGMPTYTATNDWPRIANATSLVFVREIVKADAGRVKGLDYYARCRVRLWNDSAFVQSEALLLLSSLTNSHTLLPSTP